jgi:predicted ATPase/signal transduction histidine kinase/serine/threonine protein kinase
VAVTASYAVAGLVRGGESTLYRGISSADGQPVLIKVPQSHHPRELTRLKHEFDLARLLDLSVIVRPLALDTFQGQPALVLEDFEGESLAAQLDQPMPIERFLPLAIKLTAALAAVHQRGVIHKALQPQSILVHATTGEIRIADFGRATMAAREQKIAHGARLIEGALPYIAPEQTGWMNRAVDSRSDLYSLGVIFYQLLTGQLPFVGRDPLQWVHCHIAASPVPPAQRLAQIAAGREVGPIPTIVSDIVMKLLAKGAEERYQGARGLQHDLERCQQLIADAQEGSATGHSTRSPSIEPFALATRDFSDHLQIPQKLYGRKTPLAVLQAAFARVAAGGTAEMILLAGPAGIGKSALVNELRRPVVERSGFFLAGKFDQYKRNIPYSTIAQALRELALDLLAGSEEQVVFWRDRLRGALGRYGQSIVDLVPTLGSLIGAQPPLPTLSEMEAQRCFFDTMSNLLAALASAEHPVVLFVDDLQWVDSASLDLLTHVVSSPSTRHLLIVGAYRDAETPASHPLLLALSRIRSTGVKVTDIVLGPLTAAHLTDLLVETTRCLTATVRSLAALMHEKTAGNPFFVLQFLGELEQETLLAFDPATATWGWDVDKIRAKGITDNVVDLMVGRLRRLRARTREMLKLAACAGGTSDVETLALIANRSSDQVHDDLGEAVNAGLLSRQDGTYRFPHDRIRQAAYSLIAPGDRPQVHLEIGRLLQARLRDDDPPEVLFEATDQLNRGASLVVDRQERAALAALNHRAGRRARLAGAFGVALDHADLGVALLSPDDWQTRHDLAFALSLDQAEGHLLGGDLATAERRFTELQPRAHSRLERAILHRLLVDLHTKRGDWVRAFENARTCLELYGITLPADPTAAEVAVQEDELRRQLGDRSPLDLRELPLLRDPDLEAAVQILATVLPGAYFAVPLLHRLVALHLVILTLRNGVTPTAPMAFMAYGLELCIAERYAEADQFGQLGCALVDRHGFVASRPHVYLMAAASTSGFSHPLSSSLTAFEICFRGCIEVGDLLYASLGATWLPMAPHLAGGHLEQVVERGQAAIDFVRRTQYTVFVPSMAAVRNLSRSMHDPSVTTLTLDGPDLSEAEFETKIAPVTLPVVTFIYYLYKVQSRYYQCDWTGAAAAAQQARALYFAMRGQIIAPEAHTFCALALAAACVESGPASDPTRDAMLAQIAENLAHLAAVARSCPANFASRHALVAAELARIEGRESQALDHYEQAISAAHEHGQIQFEALANELAGRHHLRRGRATAARPYLAGAITAYERWGALAKVAALRREHGKLLAQGPSGAPSSTASVVRPEQFDLLSASKASQAISGHIEQGGLVEALLAVAREQAGAERAVMIFERDGALVKAAEVAHGTSAVPPSQGQGDVDIPLQAVRLAWRTAEPVVLDASAEITRFSADPYLTLVRPRSILCLPIVRQGTVVGLLYLENRQVAGAFTTERLAALELIAAQAAISLQNAALLQAEREARTAAETAQQRAAFLAQATALVSESLEPETVLDRVAGLVVGSLARWCFIDLVEGGEIRRVAARHVDPAQDAVLTELRQRYSARWDSPQPAAQVIKTGQSILVAEVTAAALDRYVVDDEHRRLVSAMGTASGMVVPISVRGRPLGAITLGRGSGEPRFDAADLTLAEELSGRVAIAIENARLYQQAQAAIRLRDEFLTVASHELNAPVATFMLTLEGMAPGPGDRQPKPERMLTMAQRALGQGRRLSRLVGELLDATRLDRGQLRIEPEPMDLGALIESSVSQYASELERAECEVTLQLAAGLVGSWDPLRIEQVIVNLLSNAVKFGAKKPIALRLVREDDFAKLSVEDHGIGIDPAHQGHIFDRFARAVSAVNYGGLGLGLYICRSIVEAHGGSIGVVSQPGRGATFTVRLPLGPHGR